jgi:hypothetical protein
MLLNRQPQPSANPGITTSIARGDMEIPAQEIPRQIQGQKIPEQKILRPAQGKSLDLARMRIERDRARKHERCAPLPHFFTRMESGK